jgi:hypothetical protein
LSSCVLFWTVRYGPPEVRDSDVHSIGGAAVKDYQASLEKLRMDAAEAAIIRDLATDPTKREMFARLAEHLGRLADEVERAMANPPS